MSVRPRNDALMAKVLDLLAENSALKAELQRKEEVILEFEKKANGRKKGFCELLSCGVSDILIIVFLFTNF